MWWSEAPTAWFLFAPIMMLACMLGMFFMMRGMHSRSRSVWPSIEAERIGPQLAAHVPQALSPFEEYRGETLRRLDLEQKDFQDFIGRLRTARDKAEFDAFMVHRGAQAASPPSTATEGGPHGR